MTGTAGSPVPDLGGGLWRRIDGAVSAVTGTGTLWNGQVVYSDPADHERGSVGLDGTVRLSAEHVVEPLEVLLRKPWPALTESELVAARGALKAVTHEWMHLAFRPGVTLADRERDLEREECFPIEEGVTEALAHRSVSRIATAVLPHYLADRINAVQDIRSYPAYAPAADQFAGMVAAETGVSQDEVLRSMLVEPRARKARAAAELLYETSDLPQLVRTPEDRLRAVSRLSGQINRGFIQLRDMQDHWPVDRVGTSAVRGLQIADATTQVLRGLEQQHRAAATEPQRSVARVWIVDRAGTVNRQVSEIERLRGVLDGQAPPTPGVSPGNNPRRDQRGGQSWTQGSGQDSNRLGTGRTIPGGGQPSPVKAASAWRTYGRGQPGAGPQR